MATSRTKLNRPRVVLDTSLVLSALATCGDPIAVLRRGWQSQQFTPLASKATTSEPIHVLADPELALTTDEQEDLLSDYLPFCETVKVPDSLQHAPICRDPYHAPFLKRAIVSDAELFVTGAQHLLRLSIELSCLAVMADDFLAELEPE